MKTALKSFSSIFFSFCLLVIFSETVHARPLFNGKNLKGWYAFTKKDGRQNDAEKVFPVENGVIKMQGPQAGYLMSIQSFCNYQLSLEYRWSASGNKTKNSGVMYHVGEAVKDTLWPKGIQFQVKDGGTGDFILLGGVTMQVNDTINKPGRSETMKRFKDAELPAGEWNKIKIITCGNECSQYLNGQLVNKGKASVNEGRILLQFEGSPIEFRKIELRNNTRK